MTFELRVSLRSETPVVGYELNPNTSCYSKDLDKIPEHSLKFNWYRLQTEERVFCSVHLSEIATFQCMCCVTLKIPVKESYHCSAKCFLDKWQNHRIRHWKAPRRSCGSWSSSKKGSVMAEGGGESWLEVGSSKTYIPSMVDFGYKLKLESLAIDRKEGNPLTATKVIVTDPVIIAPVPRPRCMIPPEPMYGYSNISLESRPCVTGTFSVLSYNVLADFYISNETYSYCPTWALTWEYRQQNLLREIIGYKADIICLQEVQSDHFEDFFKPEMVKLGYAVVYKKKTGGLEFNKIARTVVGALKLSDYKGLSSDCIRLIKDNVALIVILEAMENGAVSDTWDCRICVANTHVLANQNLSDVKVWQVATLINELEKIANLHIPVLICGDLNSLPGSAPHELLVKGKVSHDHEDLAKAPVEIFQHLELSHQLPLVSAYSYSVFAQQRSKMNPETNEPQFTFFTANLVGTLDYILYSANRLTVEGLLELLDKQSAMEHTALPSPLWSSDHIALMAKFSLKPERKNQTS